MCPDAQYYKLALLAKVHDMLQINNLKGRFNKLCQAKGLLCRQVLTVAARQSRRLCAPYYFQENIQFQEHVLASSYLGYVATLCWQPGNPEGN